MTKQQIERVIELMNRVTLEINEVNILTEKSEFEREGSALWVQAYNYKNKFMDMLKSEAINEKLS